MNVMRLNVFVLLSAVLVAATASVEASEQKTASGRTVLSVSQRAAVPATKKTVRRASRHSYPSARLVPPPPAYMPSILPELYYRQHHHQAAPTVADASVEEEKPEDPYKKYFYSATDEDVKPVQHRSGVSTWIAPVSYRQRAN